MRYKVLNLYAGVGGNRKLWENVDVTAVEIDPSIAHAYAALYPDDEVVVDDAHQYLLEHFREFDFIWSSPPCQSHSGMRQHLRVRYGKGVEPVFPDMRLYEEIIFLQANAEPNCAWVIENVKPYYGPLIEPTAILQRHLYWSNFEILEAEFPKSHLRSDQIQGLQEYLGIDLSAFKISNRRQVLRNCVLPAIGQHVFNSSIREREDYIRLDPNKPAPDLALEFPEGLF